MSYYEDFEAPYELYERWTKGAKMSKQCPSCGGDCGYTKAKGCRQIANNSGVQGLAQLGRNALDRIAELERHLAKYRNLKPVAWMWDEAKYAETDVRGRCWSPMIGIRHPMNPQMTRNIVPLYTMKEPKK